MSIDLLYNRPGRRNEPMKVSTRDRYALRIILDIAIYQDHGIDLAEE